MFLLLADACCGIQRFAQANITKCHALGGLNNRNFLSFGDWKSKMGVLSVWLGSHNGISTLITDAREFSLPLSLSNAPPPSFSPSLHTFNKKVAVCKPGRGLLPGSELSRGFCNFEFAFSSTFYKLKLQACKRAWCGGSAVQSGG